MGVAETRPFLSPRKCTDWEGELERNLRGVVKFCGPGVDVVNVMSDRK
jgi:hypothetical protein